MTIFRYALYRVFRNKVNLLFLILVPIACIFLPGADYWPFFPYGYQYFGIIMLFVGIRLATIILEDRIQGVVKRLSVAPISYFRYLSQHLLAYAVIMISQCVIVVVGGVILGQELFQPILLLMLYISFSFTSLAIALAWISIYRSKEVAFLIYMSIIFLAALLGGVLVPLEVFPEMLKRVAVILPTYWLSEGMTWIVYGKQITDYLIINGILWLYTIVFVIIGSTRRMH